MNFSGLQRGAARLNLDPVNETYARVLVLYDERMAYIHEAATSRITLWADWYQACQIGTDTAFITACESTILFMENDYILRLYDFATEVYALLVQHDWRLAKMVLDDVVELVPGAEAGFVFRLENFVVGYEGVVRGSARYVRVGGVLMDEGGRRG